MGNVATRVSRREFIQHTSKWLKEVPLIITNRGVDELEVSVARKDRIEAEVATLVPVAEVATSIEVASTRFRRNPLEYGCGCGREVGKTLCSKHGRY